MVVLSTSYTRQELGLRVSLRPSRPAILASQWTFFDSVLDTPGKLGKILIGMNRALGDIPLTIKVRTGVREGKNTAHKLVPRLGSWGIGAFAIHGRTRQQRYSKLADWSYIKECVDVLRTTAADDDRTFTLDVRSLRLIPCFCSSDHPDLRWRRCIFIRRLLEQA